MGGINNYENIVASLLVLLTCSSVISCVGTLLLNQAETANSSESMESIDAMVCGEGWGVSVKEFARREVLEFSSGGRGGCEMRR